MTDKQTFVIDGQDFSTLAEFYEAVTRALHIAGPWGHNYDAFNDILWGGFGTPADGFTLIWAHSELSRQRLANPYFSGPQTEFDKLVEIVGLHPDIVLKLE